MAVLGAEDARGNAGGMIVAGLARHVLLMSPARRLEIEHRDLRGEQRGLDQLAFARLLALQERDEDAHRGEDAGGEIGDRDADAHRALARQPGDGHETAHALRDLVDAGPLAIGAGLAEAGNAGIDEALVERLQASRNRCRGGTSRRGGNSPPARRHPPTSALRIASPSGFFRLSVMARLLRCRFWKSGPCRSPPSPPSPSADLDLDHVARPNRRAGARRSGPARTRVKSITLNRDNGSLLMIASRHNYPWSARAGQGSCHGVWEGLYRSAPTKEG